MGTMDDFRRDCEQRRKEIWKDIREMQQALAVLKSKFGLTVLVGNAVVTAVVVYVVQRLMQG